MTALTQNKPRTYSGTPQRGAAPLAADTRVYDGEAIGRNAADGTARSLQAGDSFIGFAAFSVTSVGNPGGAAAVQVLLVSAGEVELAVPGVTAAHAGAAVYCIGGDTFALAGASLVGNIVRVPSAGVAVVAFDAARPSVTTEQLDVVRAIVSNAQSLAESTSLIALADYETQWPAARQRALTLPNPYDGQDNAPIHPSMLSFETPWNGYLFWVAYTPYPGADSQYENPCVAASNDLATWSAPATNPLVAYPGSADYNADTHLFMSADGATMYLAFRERGVDNENRLKVMHTTDGVTWSTPQTILSGAVGAQDFGSPSLWWNGSAWTLLSSNLDDSSPWPIQRRVSTTSDVYGAWGAATTVTMAPPSTRSWWHHCFASVGSSHVIGIAQDNAGSSGASGNLYYVESPDDGANFVVLGAVGTAGGKYRSSIGTRRDGDRIVLDLLIGTLSGTITHVEARPGLIGMRRALAAELSAALVAGAALPPYVVFSDNGTRADSSSTPNPASCGLNWTVSSGTWGIDTNRLYPVASGRLLYDTNSANHRIIARFADMTTSIQQWLIARGADSSNYYRFGMTSPSASGAQTLVVQDVVGGAVQSTTTIGNLSRGEYLTVEALGGVLRVHVNGQFVHEMLAARFPTGDLVGLQANAGASTRFDDVVIQAF